MKHALKRTTNVFFAFLLTVMSVNLSGVLALENAYAATITACTSGSLLAEYNYSSGYTAVHGASDVTVSGNASNGSFSVVKANTTVSQLILTSGTDSITDSYSNVTSGNFSKNDSTHIGNITNVKVCGTTNTSNSSGGSTSMPSNNGTLKIHEKGTASGTESNDPKVCQFNFEGYGFDAGQTGYIKVATQGGQNDGVDSLSPSQYNFGPADSSGNWVAGDYINDGGAYSLPNGQYKATLYGKDTAKPGFADLTNVKADSKVFKVDCPSATPAAPTVKADTCGTGSDKFTIPATTGIDYLVNGALTPAGDYNTNGASSVSITAQAQNGYVLSGTASWTLTFDTTACPIPVTATAPTVFVDACGTANDKFTLPSVTGVDYYVNGVKTAAGNIGTGGNSSVVITAQAQPGYTLTGTATWTLPFDTAACPVDITPTAPSTSDKCGTAQDSYTIPTTTGVKYQVSTDQGLTYTDASANTYLGFGDIWVKAVANGNYTLSGTKLWKFSFNSSNCPVTATGPSKIDLCGIANDTYTIPTTPHVTYKKATTTWVNIPWLPNLPWIPSFPWTTYSTINAGTYPGSGTVTIIAVPDTGYTITGTSTWTFDFDASPCLTEVQSIPPTFNDVCGVNQDSYIIPSVTGVKYFVKEGAGKWHKVKAGTYMYTDAGRVKIKAAAKEGYELTSEDNNWKFIFTNEACKPVPCTPTLIPALALPTLTNNDNCEPGRGNIDGDVPQTPQTPQTPSVVQTTTVYPTNTPVELPETGANPAQQLLTVIAAGIAAYGAMYYLLGRRNLASKNN